MKTTTLTKPKFYHFSQNNSGGYFVEDNDHGVCESVIIEAISAPDALAILNKIGENVTNFHDYCSCCGERWSDWLDETDAEDFPSIYGTPIESIAKGMFRKRAFVHYLDGSIVEYKFV